MTKPKIHNHCPNIHLATVSTTFHSLCLSSRCQLPTSTPCSHAGACGQCRMALAGETAALARPSWPRTRRPRLHCTRCKTTTVLATSLVANRAELPSSTVLLVAELTKSGQCWAKARPRKPMPSITRLINRQSWRNRPGCAANSHAPETAMGSLRCTLASARVPASMQPTTNTDQTHIIWPIPAKP